MTEPQTGINAIFTKLGGGKAYKVFQTARDATYSLTQSPDRMPLTDAHRQMVLTDSLKGKPYYKPYRGRDNGYAAASPETPTRDTYPPPRRRYDAAPPSQPQRPYDDNLFPSEEGITVPSDPHNNPSPRQDPVYNNAHGSFLSGDIDIHSESPTSGVDSKRFDSPQQGLADTDLINRAASQTPMQGQIDSQSAGLQLISTHTVSGVGMGAEATPPQAEPIYPAPQTPIQHQTNSSQFPARFPSVEIEMTDQPPHPSTPETPTQKEVDSSQFPPRLPSVEMGSGENLPDCYQPSHMSTSSYPASGMKAPSQPISAPSCHSTGQHSSSPPPTPESETNMDADTTPPTQPISTPSYHFTSQHSSNLPSTPESETNMDADATPPTQPNSTPSYHFTGQHSSNLPSTPESGTNMDADTTPPTQPISTPSYHFTSQHSTSQRSTNPHFTPQPSRQHISSYPAISQFSSPLPSGGFTTPLGNLEALFQRAVTNCFSGLQPAILEAVQTSVAQGLAALPGANTLSSTTSPDSDDDEDDLPVFRHRRRKVSPRGDSNFLHAAFRQYLREKNVIGGAKESLPPSTASPEAVHFFELNNTEGPELSAIQLDWSSALKSRWNTEAISLLCLDFERQLKEGNFPAVSYDPKTMGIKQLRKYLLTSFKRPQKAYKDHATLEAMAKEHSMTVVATAAKEVKEKTNLPTIRDRRYHRKQGTFKRRKRIIKENQSRDPQAWGQVQTILMYLGVDGMSGDETDSPPQAPKKVRRTALFWRNEELSTMFDAVESYNKALRAEQMKAPIGNQALPREFASRKYDAAHPIPGLPRNWYSDQWVQGVPSATQKTYGFKDPMIIPVIPRNGVPTPDSPS
ncbi:hypothetical protein BJ138DRAFT_1119983 [Hygrophoropsis aurantiaca]|uniref:Uncharacterized protein n=1 Tax=Hygrophoropsis aurantiaca TaxID=72124 RepID=A0ACB7ZS05_9AGAM|nr:hypothetical protein BJ138DRAFT_1119983 [Hygrophoropsis aurantiaca]